jgi:hypothetical protein
MTIAKAVVIAFWNEARKGKLASTATALDIALQACLDDLSNFNFLLKSDTGQTLTSSSKYLEYPTLYKKVVKGGIVLNDGNYDLSPLIKLPGGWEEYGQLMRSFNDGGRTTPTNFAEIDRKFYLYRPPGASYTSKIWFYKYHAQDVATIEFGDEFKNAICFGTVYFKSTIQGNAKYEAIWEPRYREQKALCRLNMPSQPAIVRG